MKKTILVLFLLGISYSANAQTDGIMQFDFKTQRIKGEYAPKHVLATWVTDKHGAWVKTCSMNARSKKKWLVAFSRVNPGYNVTDAQTGATLRKHIAHQITWNGRDSNGRLVPDGSYTVWVECTSNNRKGVIEAFPFIKGKKPVSLSPGNSPNYIDTKLEWTPKK